MVQPIMANAMSYLAGPPKDKEFPASVCESPKDGHTVSRCSLLCPNRLQEVDADRTTRDSQLLTFNATVHVLLLGCRMDSVLISRI